MLIEKKNTADLLPADYNPRKDLKPGDAEYEKLKRSIEQFGYVEPVIWNKTTGRVVGGHQRLKVLIDMGISEVECVVVEMDEDKEKALNIALNKISGDWDKDKLALLISDLQGSDFDVSLTGFDPAEIDVLDEENIMRSLGTTITTSGEHKINIAATKPAAAWIEEGGALTFGDATFDQIILDAHKLHVAIKVTEELLYDNAFGLENYIIQQFGKALANAEEDAFLNGSGKGQPLGILAATGGAEVGVTAASATAITADEIINLIYSLKRPYRKNAKFMCNDQTLAAIRKLKDSTGQYLWQPSLQSGEPDRILGYEVMTSPYFPVIAAGKPAMAFGDFSYYNIGDRGTRSFAELKELFAGNGMVGFVAKERVDGKLVLPEAVKLLQMKAA